MAELNVGILIIGSLIWNPELHRERWRSSRLLCKKAIKVAAPIRYGRISKNKTFTMVLFSVIVDKLTLPIKQDGHLLAECTFNAFANSLNKVGFITSTSVVGGGA